MTAAANPRAMRLVARVVFPLYAATLTAGTHWPDLAAPSPGVDHFDKLLHFGAFFGGTLLLGLTGWLGPVGSARTALRALFIGALWATADELTQAIPGLGRTASFFDLLADLVGVAAASLALVFMGLRRLKARSPKTF